MDFLKKFIVGTAKFAYAFFIEPIVHLRNVMQESGSRRIVSVLEAASRLIIMSSWVLPVPALLVSLAWLWVGTALLSLTIFMVFQLGMMYAVMGSMEKIADKEAVPAAA